MEFIIWNELALLYVSMHASSYTIPHLIMLQFLLSLSLRLKYHISMIAIHVAFCPFVTNCIQSTTTIILALSRSPDGC